MTDCSHCPVGDSAICAGLSADALQCLGQLGRKQKVRRGQTLVWEGDEALVVANVISGILKLSISTADGREQIVGVVFPSDFIGRPFGKESPHSVTALTDSELCVFTRAAFDGFARQHPDLQNRLLMRTLTELDRARHWMLLLGKKTASERIASLLLEVSDRMGNGAAKAAAGLPEVFEMPLDRQQMGDVLGLTIETVSRQLTKLKGAEMIDLPNRRTVVIQDRARLRNLALAA